MDGSGWAVEAGEIESRVFRLLRTPPVESRQQLVVRCVNISAEKCMNIHYERHV